MEQSLKQPGPAQAEVAASDQASDLLLLQRVRAGDEQAFSQLVTGLFPKVYRAAARVLRYDQEAEDVAQEVFFKIWRQPPELKPGTTLAMWSVRVAINGAIDRLRKKSPDLTDTVPERPDPGADAEVVMQENEATNFVRAAIDGLPGRQKIALILTYYEGFSNKEAAKLLEVSVDALESLLSRARRSLRATLANRWGELLDDLARSGANDGGWGTI